MTGFDDPEMPDPFIYTPDDVLRMLDALMDSRGSAWWGEFFADRAKSCPFFVEWPDENLAEWFGDGTLMPGRVLDLRCHVHRGVLRPRLRLRLLPPPSAAPP